MGRYRINKRFVDGLEAPEKVTSYPDQQLRGFSLRVTPGGVKSYCIRYRDAGGRFRRETPIRGRVDQRWFLHL